LIIIYAHYFGEHIFKVVPAGYAWFYLLQSGEKFSDVGGATMKITKKWLAPFGWLFLGVMVGWLFPMSQVRAVGRFVFSDETYRIAKTTYLFQRMCSQLLPSTPLGQHYLDLGYTHMNRLVRLLWYDATMTEQTWKVIDLYSPAVEALLDGEGDSVKITQEMVDELLVFLDGMEQRADEDLRQIIQEERSRVPWDELVGLTAEEAWIKLQEATPASP
jgi:hypothetical protein